MLKVKTGPKKLTLRRAVIGLGQPFLNLVAKQSNGKTGVALTAAALNPDMSQEDGCPPNFLKLFEPTGIDKDGNQKRLIEPIKQVVIANGEKDADRVLTIIGDFPQQMKDRIFILDTYPENEPYNQEASIQTFEDFNVDKELQSKVSNCNIYDSVSTYITDLNDKQREVSKEYADEGNDVKNPMKKDSELAKPYRFDWGWRNSHVSMFLKNLCGFKSMKILVTRFKKEFKGSEWTGKYEAGVPDSYIYSEGARIVLTRDKSKIKAKVHRNRYGPVNIGQERMFDLNMWTLTNILLWIYGLN